MLRGEEPVRADVDDGLSLGVHSWTLPFLLMQTALSMKHLSLKDLQP